MIGLSGEIPLVSHSDVTSPFPPSGNGGYASNRDDLKAVGSDSCGTNADKLKMSSIVWSNVDSSGSN